MTQDQPLDRPIATYLEEITRACELDRALPSGPQRGAAYMEKRVLQERLFEPMADALGEAAELVRLAHGRIEHGPACRAGPNSDCDCWAWEIEQRARDWLERHGFDKGGDER